MTTMNVPDSNDAIIVYLDPDLEDIVPGFLHNRRKDIETLTACMENGQLDTIRLLGHRLKGDGGGYGFNAISSIGHTLEQAALRGDLATIRESTAELTNFLTRVQVVYKR
jgi:HPt (histidine-containing phosphotransfer) domain-containing protein